MSLFVFLLNAFVRSEYIEITSKNADTIIGGKQPALVKFYSPNCGHCKAMAPDFAESATTFTDVTYGGIDCSAEKKVCDKFKVEGYPTIYLFKAGSKEGIEFEGTRSVDGFCDFVENYTTSKAKRPPKVLLDLNPINFQNNTQSRKCTFVTFFAPWCGHCKAFIPNAKIAAAAFQADPEIAVGSLNCDLYKDFCSTLDIHGYPTIKLFKNGVAEPIAFDGERSADGVCNFINTNCGTERHSSGLLIDTAGVVESARPIVEEFLAGDKTAADRIKAIEGTEFYLKTIERINAKGIEQLAKDVDTMVAILQARKGSTKALDGIKRRLNVFNQFLHPQKEQQTVPAPESAAPDAEPQAEAQKEL